MKNIKPKLNQPQAYLPRTNFKKLNLFGLASGSLLLSGFLLRPEADWKILVILIWCNLSGVFLIYRLNDCIDQDADLKFNLSYFFSYRLHQLVVGQFILLAIPAAFFYLDFFTLQILSVSALAGTIYSLSFKLNGKLFRIKNVFLLKNSLIGTVWGALILIGAGNLNPPLILSLFVFTSLQVVIGSLIRDVPDLEKDKNSGVKSLPVVLGLKPTFWFMQTANVLSVFSGFLCDWHPLMFTLIPTIVLWRLTNIIFLQKNTKSVLWGQQVNLLTCVLIAVIILTYRIYEFI